MNEDTELVSKSVSPKLGESHNVVKAQQELHNIINDSRKELHIIFDKIGLDYEK